MLTTQHCFPSNFQRMGKYIKYIQQDRVALVKFIRTERNNAFHGPMVAEFVDSLVALSGKVDVLILAAEGRSFCSGADLSWFASLQAGAADERLHQCIAISTMLHQLYSFPGITISLTHGRVFGLGVGLAAASDMAIGTPDTTFVLSEVTLGIAPACILPYLTAKCPKGLLTGPVLTSQPISASQARNIGLLQEVADLTGNEDPFLLVNRILKGKQMATVDAARILRQYYPVDPDMAESTGKQLAYLLGSAEAQTSIRQFLERSQGGAI